MTKLFIPQIGNELKLIANWNCKVFGDRLNASVFKSLNIEPDAYIDKNVDITFPKLTVLKVDRLYVRNPASSYDSITFRITQCPIKSLVKSRFFVKLMDANKIEFEEIVQSITGFKKLIDSYRFVALSNDFKNSEYLKEKESTFVSKILYEEFKSKEIIFKFNMSVENVFNTMVFQRYKRDHNLRQLNLQKVKSLIQSDIELIYHVVPALDGFVSYFEIAKEATQMEQLLDINNKEVIDYYGTILGTPLARLVYKSEFATKIPSELAKLKYSVFELEVIYQGRTFEIDNFKSLQKFFKEIHSKP